MQQLAARPTDPFLEDAQASYYRARYYDSTAGRFLNEDPLGFLAGVNKYRFVHNGPSNWVDRFGTSESGCGCPDRSSNKMPLGRRLSLAFSGIANVAVGGTSIGLALGAEVETVGIATPVAAYVAVQGAGHFVQGLTQVLVAVAGDNAGEALVQSATDVTNDISIYGLATRFIHNRELSATARSYEGFLTTLVLEPQNLPLIALEGAHSVQEGLGLFPKKCPAQ
jgi:RHS repeat-associated protein